MRAQDAYFVAKPDADTMVWGVLDGHGPDNGTLAAQVAAVSFREWCAEHPEELTLALALTLNPNPNPQPQPQPEP